MIYEITIKQPSTWWDNKDFEGIYYSIFVASFNKTLFWYALRNGTDMGRVNRFRLMRKWLSQLVINGKKMPEDVINDICNMMDNGKLELENNCSRFIESEFNGENHSI